MRLIVEKVPVIEPTGRLDAYASAGAGAEARLLSSA